MKNILAAHNTLSYLPIYRWWMYPLKWFSKCQSEDIKTQYELGVRLFDLRILLRGGDFRIGHGLVTYKGDIKEFLDYLAGLNDPEVLVQLVNEDTYYKSDVAEWNKKVDELIANYPNLKFTIVESKKTWKVIRNDFPRNMKSYSCFWRFKDTSPIPLPILHKECYTDDIEYYKESTNSVFWFDFIDKRFK